MNCKVTTSSSENGCDSNEVISPHVSFSIKQEDIKEEGAAESKSILNIEAEEEIKYFECKKCSFREKYEYFGRQPPFITTVFFLEDYFYIEDPFIAPKQGAYIVLGGHCTKCKICVCKDPKCSFYYEKTYCISCAKDIQLPNSIMAKIQKIA